MKAVKHFSLSPAELEFFSEEAKVTIVPQFTGPVIDFLCGKAGPFKVMKPTEVPLWVAVYLRGRGKATISVPDYFGREYLEAMEKAERESEELLAFPEHFFSVFHVLFERLVHQREG